jgi:hypothetical protein
MCAAIRIETLGLLSLLLATAQSEAAPGIATFHSTGNLPFCELGKSRTTDHRQVTENTYSAGFKKRVADGI